MIAAQLAPDRGLVASDSLTLAAAVSASAAALDAALLALGAEMDRRDAAMTAFRAAHGEGPWSPAIEARLSRLPA